MANVSSVVNAYKVLSRGFYSAWIRASIQYRDLKLGYLWEIFSLLFVVSFLALVWGKMLVAGPRADYFFYVLTGFNCWNLMSSFVAQSVSFRNRASMEAKRGISDLNIQTLADSAYPFVLFSLSFPFVLLACVSYFGMTLVNIAFLVMSLVCIFIAGRSVIILLGLVSIFFEDINQMVKMVMRVAFLMTPILWMPKMLGARSMEYVYLNPFFSFLDVFRSSLTGKEVASLSIFVMVLVSLVLLIVSQLLFTKLKGKAAYRIFVFNND